MPKQDVDRLRQLADRPSHAAPGATDPQPAEAARRSVDLDRQRAQSPNNTASHVEPVTNEARANAALQQTPGKLGHIVWGKITYAAPYINWYKVQLDGMQGDIGACHLTATSVSPYSVRDISPITPGTHVLVLKQGLDYGIILGCMPTPVTETSRIHPDWISQGANCGFKREKYYADTLTSMFDRSGNAVDFSNNRPLDALSIGEWGFFNDLGGGIFIDAMMSFLRVDEGCGLWMFYMDRLLRICAHNYDWQTSMDEMRRRDDSGEGHGFRASTAYAWEPLGAYSHGEAVHAEVSDEDVHFKKPYGKFEPKENLESGKLIQQPFYRYEEYEGYLGQAFMRHVILPPESNSSGLRKYPDKEVLQGVFREQISMDGGYALESAQSISIMKRFLIPVPKQLLLPEDPTGDDLDEKKGYKFAGFFGEGPAHKIRSAPKIVGELPHVLCATAMLDMLAYTYNWKGLHPFHYHVKDYFLPEQTDVVTGHVLQWVPDFNDLRYKMWLEPPSAQNTLVDHRYHADYYETQAGVVITPEGAVVIRDAWGSEIRMVGGEIFSSAAGDIYQQSGRSIINYAGDDIVLRALQSVDITATNHDVRLKAERHAEILAGNARYGRLLLHCRSQSYQHDVKGKFGEDVGQSGLILKSEGELIGWGRSMYLRTTGGGDITLDANKGNSNLNVIANLENHHLNYGFHIAYPATENNKTTTYQFGKYECIIPVLTEVGNRLSITDNGLWVRGPLLLVGGDIRSDGNPSGQIHQHHPHQRSWDVTTEWLDGRQKAIKEINEKLTEWYKTFVKDPLYAEHKAGHDEVIENTQFAPRNNDQLRTKDWKLPETFWQQLITTHGFSTGTWRETPIVYQGEPMMPHPGFDKWTGGDNFLQVKLKLHDPETGCDKPRAGGVYDDPELNEWQTGAADGNYPVISEG